MSVLFGYRTVLYSNSKYLWSTELWCRRASPAKTISIHYTYTQNRTRQDPHCAKAKWFNFVLFLNVIKWKSQNILKFMQSSFYSINSFQMLQQNSNKTLFSANVCIAHKTNTESIILARLLMLMLLLLLLLLLFFVLRTNSFRLIHSKAIASLVASRHIFFSRLIFMHSNRSTV